MAIKVSQAFQRTSANPVDETMALTKAQMLTVNDNLMPDYYFTICQDDGQIYLYDKTATPSATTGKFAKFEGGGGGGGGTSEGVVITKTLLASGWNTNNQQTLTFTGYETSMGGVIGMPINATTAQKDAYAEAVINVVTQSGNQFTFEADTIPSIDLPVTLYAGGGSGGGGASLPAGGTTGQALVKKSNADQDVEWGDVSGEQIQYDTMPTASATNVGQIVQFIGTTDANYTNGLFYECVNDSGTYSWVQKDVQNYPEADLTNVFSSGMPVASVSGDRRFNYQTDEHEVGTWIDGSIVYQKTILISSQSTAVKNYPLSDFGITNHDKTIAVWGILPNVGVPIGYYYASDNYLSANVGSDKSLSISAPTQAHNFPLYVTLQYTKTS